MHNHRSSTFVWCAITTLCVAGLHSVAQAAETIYVGGQRVIVLRGPGTYASIEDRAAAVNKAITEVISSQDTQNPRVEVDKIDGLWTVSVGGVRVVSASPAEAKANAVTEESVALTWASFLKRALPRCTPPSKIGATATAKTAATPVTPAPTEPTEDEVPPVAPVSPVAAVPTVEPVAVETPPAGRAIAAPTLLVRDAFDTVRKLPEEEYAAQRDAIVQHLIADLTPFITGKVAGTAGGPAVAAVTPGPAPRPTPAVGGGPRTPAPTAPTAATGAPKPAIIPGPAARNLPTAKAGDPNYAKVPQKNRIRQKLELARKPLSALMQEDPGTAQPIDALVAKSRAAFWQGEYDESEQLVDSALALLGVEYAEEG